MFSNMLQITWRACAAARDICATRTCEGRIIAILCPAQGFHTNLERWEWQRNTMFLEARQNKLMDFMAQWHTVSHFCGVHTQLENLDPLL